MLPSNAPHGVREDHAPHAWGTCQALSPLTNSLRFTAGESTGHQIRNSKTGRAWISYSRMGAFYTKFRITTPELLLFLYVSACLSCCLFSDQLSVYYYYICNIVHTPCTYLVYYMYVYVSVRYSLLDDTECRDPVYCIAHTMSTRSISPVRLLVYWSSLDFLFENRCVLY